MGESYIVRHCGFGIRSTDAILRVIAPAGSTVTITKGGVSKSDAGHQNADDSSLYDYYFVIHQSQFDSINAWTVTATLGTQTMSGTIIIDSADEYDMVISYTLWLIQNGASQVGNLTAIGLKRDSSSTASATAPSISYQSTYVQIGWTATGSAQQAGIAYFPSKIDFSKYRTMHITGSARNDGTYTYHAAANAWTEIGAYQDSNRVMHQPLIDSTPSSYTTFERITDISPVTAEAYIGFNAARGTSFYVSERITNLYLEA